MNWWKQLYVKVPLMVVVLALGPLIAFGTFSVQETKGVLEEFVRRNSVDVCRHAVDIAEASIDGIVQRLRMGLGDSGYDLNSPGDQEWFLQMLQKALPELHAAAFIDASGRETAKSSRERVYTRDTLENLAASEGFQAAIAGQVHIGKADSSSVGTYRLPVCLPVFDPREQKVTRVLGAEISIRTLLERITEMKVGADGIVYVALGSGDIIAHPDASVVLAGGSLKDNRHFRHLVEGEAEKFTELHSVTNENREEMLVTGHVSPRLGWVFMAEQPAGEAYSLIGRLNRDFLGLLAVMALLAGGGIYYFISRLTRPLKRLQVATEKIAGGDLDQHVGMTRDDEMGAVAHAFNTMAEGLRDAAAERGRHDWQTAGQAALENVMRGEQPVETLCRGIIAFVTEYLEAPIGALYLDGGDGVLNLTASYAYTFRKNVSNRFRPGEGLVGQAALEKHPIVLTQVPRDYVVVASGLGESPPSTILVMPLIVNDAVIGVLEIGHLRSFSDEERTFLETAARGIAVTVLSAQSRVRLREALDLTRRQAEDLRTQQEELQAANGELEERALQLQKSEESLRVQQEELAASNEELEEKSHELEAQKASLEDRNRKLEAVRREMAQKTLELERSGRNKSECRSNMGHGLRTPLNSLLILARDLSENRKGNLDADQVESAGIIYNSGRDLLALINDILDLSKIEAGKVVLNIAPVPLDRLQRTVMEMFEPLAREKGLSLQFEIGEHLPRSLHTDPVRLDQIIRNLVSNAVKFTSGGSVTVSIHRPGPDDAPSGREFDPGGWVCFSVADTGIGIPEDRQDEVFEAFRQLDGGVSRPHGGTGLGLSISRRLATLLGGEIRLRSAPGRGATFTLRLPESLGRGEPAAAPASSAVPSSGPSPHPPAPTLEDDDGRIGPDDRFVLVIEDDLRFAAILRKVLHEKGFKWRHAGDGETGIDLVRERPPDAIILDMRLPGMSGWAVLEALKGDIRLRHIPVHVMTVEADRIDVLRKGAIGFLKKPASPKDLEQALANIEKAVDGRKRRLLIVEDDPVTRQKLTALVGDGDVETRAVSTGEEALARMAADAYDCVVLDLKLPDMTGFDLLERLERKGGDATPPVIIYTAGDLTRGDEYRLRRFASSIIIKGVRSEERLLDEASLFLHRVVDNLPTEKKEMVSMLYEGDTVFEGKKVLLADDDMRNVFALSKILEEKGMRVFKAPDGQKALEILEANPGIDMALIDIMMPVMDGYDAIRGIRAQARFANLPIIAVTAKAMKEDRAGCISAGASDYFSKPIDVDRLLSLMRVWFYS